MDVRTLRSFVTVADAGTVSAAAVRLHVTQPALSRQLAQLERELAVSLFDRRAGRLHLSRAGEQFLPYARDVLHSADRARDAASGLASGRLERIVLAAPTTTLTDVIAPFLATLGPDDPAPSLRPTETGGAREALHGGADLSIGTGPVPSDLASFPVATLPLLAYVPKGDPWEARIAVTVEDLSERSLLLLERGFRQRELFDAATDRAGVAPASVIECGTAQVAQALAAAGRGVAVVSDDPRFDLRGLGIEGRDGPVTLTLHASWLPTHHAAAALHEMAVRLRSFCVDRYGPGVTPRLDGG